MSCLAALFFAACGGEQGPTPEETAAQRVPAQRVPAQRVPAQRVAVPGDDLSVLEELAHVGYVDFAEPDAEKSAGVVVDDEEGSSHGYNLVTSLPNSTATLFDMQGRALRVWTDPEVADSRWSRAVLLANGDLLCLSPKEDYLSRQTFDGRLLWRRPLNVHHDAVEVPDGRLLVLTRRFRSIPAIDEARQCVDNLLTLVSADGEVLEEHSLYDALQAEPRLLTVRTPAGIEQLPPGYNIDPIHANTVRWLEDSALSAANPAFRAGNVLVTLRYLDSVAVFDLAAERCVWAWGAGELQGPHDASLLANGHILLLDNGYAERGWSRLVELDPRTGTIVWQWRADEPSDFFTSGRGTVQALANGNVLVGNSNSGEAFELTREGHLVWRYLNPFVDEAGARGVLRIQRYDADFVERFLDSSRTGGGERGSDGAR